MSTEIDPVPAPSAGSPTITESDRLAAKVDALIDAIEGLMPFLETPHPKKSGDARAARTVSREFLAAMIANVKDQPDWQDFGFFDPAEGQAALQFGDAFHSVAHRLRIVASKIDFTIASRTATVAMGALNTYMMAKRLARRPANAHMVGPLEQLRRALGRRNGRSRRATPELHE